MSLLRSWLAGLPGYLWSGWGALASLFLLLAGWEAVASHYGALVLPTPLETFSRLLQLIAEGAVAKLAAFAPAPAVGLPCRRQSASMQPSGADRLKAWPTAHGDGRELTVKRAVPKLSEISPPPTRCSAAGR